MCGAGVECVFRTVARVFGIFRFRVDVVLHIMIGWWEKTFLKRNSELAAYACVRMTLTWYWKSFFRNFPSIFRYLCSMFMFRARCFCATFSMANARTCNRENWFSMGLSTSGLRLRGMLLYVQQPNMTFSIFRVDGNWVACIAQLFISAAKTLCATWNRRVRQRVKNEGKKTRKPKASNIIWFIKLLNHNLFFFKILSAIASLNAA